LTDEEIQSGLNKPAAEVARLVELGLAGQPDIVIARQLHWHPQTVAKAWVILGLQERVRQAKVDFRREKRRQRQAELRQRLDDILQPLLEKDEIVWMRQIGEALGLKGHLNIDPVLRAYVREVLQQHNSKVKQKQEKALREAVLQALEQLPYCDEDVKVEEIMLQAGLTYKVCHQNYPNLRVLISQAVTAHRKRLKALRIEAEVQQIEAAAARLMSQGVRLNYKTILREAGLSEYGSKHPKLQEALLRWNGNFAPRD
jgi:hypothetical protein